MVTGVFSQQKSESKTITVEGGAQKNVFKLTADQYEENRHFFLAQYFRDNYNKALSELPIINSPVNITKIEVWVTNIGPAVTDTNPSHIGEYIPYNPNIHSVAFGQYPSKYIQRPDVADRYQPDPQYKYSYPVP